MPYPESKTAAQSPWLFLKPYRNRVLLGCLLLLGTSALALTIPRLLGQTIEALVGPDPAGEVPELALLMIAVAVVQAAVRIGSRILLFNAARMAEYDLRSLLFRHLLTLDGGYYKRHSTGDVMSRLTNDVQTVRVMWGPGILNVVNTSFLFCVALVLMLRVDPVLTAWALVPYPSMFLLGVVFGRRIYRASGQVQAQLGALSNSIQEDLTGIAIIKSYNLEDQRLGTFARASEKLLDQNMVLTRVRGQMVPALGAVSALGTAIVLWVGGKAVIEHRIALGDMIEFSGYLAVLVWPTMALGWILSLFQRSKASWQRLREVFLTEPAIADGPGPGLDPAAVAGRLDVEHLTIEIEGQKILDDVSFSVPAGSTAAIVGRTGAGKSTLIAALARLIPVPRGSVFLDGRDICDLPLTDLRQALGFAPQEAFLFSTSIEENIGFGVDQRRRPANDAEERRRAVESAAAAAGLTRDLKALPDGLGTIVGERGITLSGGQRQRVALARAIASEPAVLVLDDSLSSVDAETEKEILDHLAGVMSRRTAILISHRLAAVRRAHQILVLDQGRLVETGTHDELLARRASYAEIYDAQIAQEVS